MKELFGLSQEILMKYRLTVVDAYIAAYILLHLDYVHKNHTKLKKEDRKQLVEDLSFLNYADRTLRYHISKLHGVIFHYQNTNIKDKYNLSFNSKLILDVFGYDSIIMKKHNLDLKDMLLISYLTELSYSNSMYHIIVENKRYTYLAWKLLNKDYPILHLESAGLKRRINVLIEKGIIERKSIFDPISHKRRNYYRVNHNHLSLLEK